MSAAHDPQRLTTCPDCGKAVSRRAERCPHCGCPFPATQEKITNPQSQARAIVPKQGEKVPPKINSAVEPNFPDRGKKSAKKWLVVVAAVVGGSFLLTGLCGFCGYGVYWLSMRPGDVEEEMIGYWIEDNPGILASSLQFGKDGSFQSHGGISTSTGTWKKIAKTGNTLTIEVDYWDTDLLGGKLPSKKMTMRITPIDRSTISLEDQSRWHRRRQ